MATATFACTGADQPWVVPAGVSSITITPDRMVRLLVHGEPGATLSGFQAWSDL